MATKTAPKASAIPSKKAPIKPKAPRVRTFTEEEIEDMDAEMEQAASDSMDYSAPLEDPNQPGNILPKGTPFPAPPEKKNGNKWS